MPDVLLLMCPYITLGSARTPSHGITLARETVPNGWRDIMAADNPAPVVTSGAQSDEAPPHAASSRAGL
jgi:hypothetical protein